MGDDLCTEEELLAHAIALSLENQLESNAPVDGAEVVNIPTSSRLDLIVHGPHETSTPEVRPGAPLRSNTTQSYDSVLNEDESFNESFKWQKQTSQDHDQESSQRSSPDLGIAAESDIDPQSGTLGVKQREDYQKSSRESLLSSPESEQVHPRGLQNITLDGRSAVIHGSSRKTPVGEESHQLPFTRLSSLHDMNLSEQSKLSKMWSPNREALELIVAMGISENAAKRGLYNTGNDNAELAVEWVFENISNPELHEPFQPPTVPLVVGAVYQSFDDMVEGTVESDRKGGPRYKMVFVANTSLGMGVGKLAAQVGHAVLGLYHCLEDQMPEVREWESRGAKKVVLKGTDTQHLLDLKQKALELHVANILIHDAGRTQIDPGSLTVLALFGQSGEVDGVTGKLKLL